MCNNFSTIAKLVAAIEDIGAADLANGNVVWSPKKDWPRLAAAMAENA